jgi:hypothetical protein
MILKIFKYIFFIILFGIICIYLSFNKNQESYTPLDKNSANTISYSIKIKDGKLKITAKKASFGKGLNSFILEKMQAEFISKTRNINISARKCNLYPKRKKAFFGPNVIIKGKDLYLATNAAVLDWSTNSLYGQSKLHGINKGIRISADGFSIKENGKITLKHAKISKKIK